MAGAERLRDAPESGSVAYETDNDGVNGQAPVKTWTVYDGRQVYADFEGSGTLNTRRLAGP